MLKKLQHTILFLIVIFLCGILLQTNAYGKQFEVGLQGNVIKTSAPDIYSGKWKTGLGGGGKIRYWWKCYLFGLELEYFQHRADWKPMYYFDERVLTFAPTPLPIFGRNEKATTIGIFPYAGFDMLPHSPVNLLFSIGTGLYRSDIDWISNAMHWPFYEKIKINRTYDWISGSNARFTFEIPFKKNLKFAVGLKYHLIFTHQKRTRFITTSGGVVF